MINTAGIDYRRVVEEIWDLGLSEPNPAGWMDGCCPLHDDKHPSFGVNIETGWWYCFVCGGGPFEVLAEAQGTTIEELQHYRLSPEEVIEAKVRKEKRRDLRNSIPQRAYKLAKWAQRARGTREDRYIESVLRAFDYQVLTIPVDAVLFVDEIVGHDEHGR